MKKLKYVLLGALISAVVSTCVVIPTLSWLSSRSQEVTNTFEGGTIAITLDEAKVDENGHKDPTQPRVTGNSYHFVAGSEVDKDPTPSVKAGSIPAYVFAVIDNEYPEVFTYTVHSDWKEVGKSGSKTLYAFKNTVDASDANDDISLTPLFTKVKISEDLTSEQLQAMKATADTQLIKVQSYAIQSQAIEKNTAIDKAAEQFGITGSLNYVEIA